MSYVTTSVGPALLKRLIFERKKNQVKCIGKTNGRKQADDRGLSPTPTTAHPDVPETNEKHNCEYREHCRDTG
jgi:hypothetical protein